MGGRSSLPDISDTSNVASPSWDLTSPHEQRASAAGTERMLLVVRALTCYVLRNRRIQLVEWHLLPPLRQTACSVSKFCRHGSSEDEETESEADFFAKNPLLQCVANL